MEPSRPNKLLAEQEIPAVVEAAQDQKALHQAARTKSIRLLLGVVRLMLPIRLRVHRMRETITRHLQQQRLARRPRIGDRAIVLLALVPVLVAPDNPVLAVALAALAPVLLVPVSMGLAVALVVPDNMVPVIALPAVSIIHPAATPPHPIVPTMAALVAQGAAHPLLSVENAVSAAGEIAVVLLHTEGDRPKAEPHNIAHHRLPLRVQRGPLAAIVRTGVRVRHHIEPLSVARQS